MDLIVNRIFFNDNVIQNGTIFNIRVIMEKLKTSMDVFNFLIVS